MYYFMRIELASKCFSIRSTRRCRSATCSLSSGVGFGKDYEMVISRTKSMATLPQELHS